MEHFLETWGYLAVFGLSFISAMGLPVGAELAMIYGGVLASGQIPNEPHHLNLVVVIVVASRAEVLGSLAGYLIGYYGGRTTCRPLREIRPADSQGPRQGRSMVRPEGRAFRALRPVHPSAPFLCLIGRWTR